MIKKLRTDFMRVVRKRTQELDHMVDTSCQSRPATKPSSYVERAPRKAIFWHIRTVESCTRQTNACSPRGNLAVP